MDDVVVVGGGIIGAATAYFLSKEGRKVRVIERDPAYKKASFPLSLGGFRRQFFQKENINLGKFALEFISDISNTLKTKNNPNPTASMVPNGYLLLFGPEHAEEQYEALKNHKACDAGTKNIPASKLKDVFSWINPKRVEKIIYIYFIHLLINGSWSIFFFGLHLILASLILIGIIIFFVVWLIKLYYPINKLSSFLMVPYLMWLSYAFVLNFYIFILN